jgi:hypothetical protein
MSFEFNAEELRAIILGKIIITKCPDCGHFSRDHIGMEPADDDGNLIPFNLVEKYTEDDNIYWYPCQTCDELGYLIKFID